MKFNIIIFMLFLGTVNLSYAQDEMSKGDIYYFEFNYEEAIEQYKKEVVSESLSNQQYLNLADSYLKVGNPKSASDTYFMIYKKDSTMSAHHFNKMLQAMSKTSGVDRVKAILSTRESTLSEELLENAEFNFELLTRDNNVGSAFTMFNITSNSPQADFSPSFYNTRLLFTSGREENAKKLYSPSGESYLDIYIARISDDGNILNPNPFTGIPSSEFHEATPYFSKALNSIFYIRSNEDEDGLIFDEKGKNTLAIGMTDAQSQFNFLLRDISTSFYYPFYHEASGRLYFAANFEDSLGGTDIYYVLTNNGLIMSAPINLGPRINTPGNEIAPYIFDTSFYFSSDVFYGLGGMDIYKSEMQDDEYFSIPVNLGEGINSDADDFGLIIRDYTEEELIGYYASNRSGGKGKDDIYGFKVKGKPGIKTFTLKGKVVNSVSNEGVFKAQVSLLDESGDVIKEVYADESGLYRVEIPWPDQITIQTSNDRYSDFSITYKEGEMEDLQSTSFDIDLILLDDLVEEKEGQSVLKLNKFYFTRGRSQLTTEIKTELDKVVDAVKNFPQLQLRIESHTDSRGGGASNFRLSQLRADAMKKYLQDQGVPSSNILFSVGYGEDKILNNCTNGVYCLEVLHKRNERQLIVVLNYNLL